MAERNLSLAAADFAVNVFRQVGDSSKDAFLSPVSISVALAMTYAGAAGGTASQMKQIMFPGLKNDDEVHEGFGGIVSMLNSSRTKCRLHTANRLYGQKSYELKPEFVAKLMKHYQSELQSVDFKKDADQVAKEINDWVAEVTVQKIKNLIPQGALDALTRLVLVNAIYFKGDWKHKFSEAVTLKKAFYSEPGRDTQVDMMAQSEDFPYTETEEVQVLGMPYADQDLAMYVFLPKERYGLKRFEESLTGQKLLDLIKKTSSRKVNVEMPKFRMEQSFSLNQALANLGMKDMFDSNKADFSNMAGVKGDLYVSAVLHKAFIEVTEEGTEAAGATAVVMACMSMPMEIEKPIVFCADHPFLLCIVNVKLSSVLFLGHLVN